MDVIGPATERGEAVVCDRFTDSTLAYQGYGRGIDPDFIRLLNRFCTCGLAPEITFLIDVDPEEGLRRNRNASKVDRIELEAIAFHRRVREGYKAIAREERARVVVLDGSAGPDVVEREIWKAYAAFRGRGGHGLR